MITIKNEAQIEGMRKAGKLLYEVLSTVRKAVVPGISTMELNDLAEKLIRDGGATPSFLGYEGYPASLCTSIDEVVVHGIPSEDTILQEGSLISMDCGLCLNGWQADSALTVGVGRISDRDRELIETTAACFFAGARQAVAGKRLGDIGSAVESLAHEHGFSVVRDLSGHGIGRDMHEDPYVYNFGFAGCGLPMRKGMTIAIEPMVCMGDWHVETDEEDGWCVRTRDGLKASHYEHTIAIFEDRLPEILTLPGFVWKEEE